MPISIQKTITATPKLSGRPESNRLNLLLGRQTCNHLHLARIMTFYETIPRGLTVPTYDLEGKYACLLTKSNRGNPYLRSRCSRTNTIPLRLFGRRKPFWYRTRRPTGGLFLHMLSRNCINRIDTRVLYFIDHHERWPTFFMARCSAGSFAQLHYVPCYINNITYWL